MNDIFTGALGVKKDERAYKQDEIGMSCTIDWNKRFSLGDFPIFDQKQSYTCGAQAGAKILGIESQLKYNKFINFSVRDIYTKRKNHPNAGMWGNDLFNIISKGVSLDQLMPTPIVNEINFNNYDDRTIIDERIAEKFSDDDLPFVEKWNPTIDDIASAIQLNHPVLLLTRWDYNEYDKPYPTVDKNSKESNGHFTTGTGFMRNGTKYIVMEDSWGTNYGEKGKRYLSEEFIKAHCKYIAYFTEFELEETGEDFKYEFTRDLTIGSIGEDVKMLQKFLQIKGYFPVNFEPTGMFYGLTRQALKDFQKNNNIYPTEGYFGEKTRAFINNI